MSLASRFFRRVMRREAVCFRLPAQLPAAHGVSSRHGFGRITRDLTMPPKDWARYDEPAYQRKPARVVRIESEPFVPAFLRRQAD